MSHARRSRSQSGTESSIALRVLCVLLVASLPVLAGCHGSRDRQAIRSTAHEPTNVSVIDTAHDRTLWRMQIPVGHELELDFRHRRDRRARRLAEAPATQMRWQLRQIGGGRPDRAQIADARRGRLSLPGTPVRMDVELRLSPDVTEPGPIEPGR